MSYLNIVFVLETQKKFEKQTKNAKEDSEPNEWRQLPRDWSASPKICFMTRTIDNNHHFNPNTRKANSESTSNKIPPTNEPPHSTHPGDATSQDETIASLNDRIPDPTKSPKWGGKNHKAKSTYCPLLSD